MAYWKCEGCGKADRAVERLPERLEEIYGEIKSPPRLVARGPAPPASKRKWATADGGILEESEPCSIHFEGREIPGLEEAHMYVKYDKDGQIEQVYEPNREKPGKYIEHYWLTRYQVIDADLVWFESHCYEESTFDIPFASKPKQRIILSELEPLSD